MKATKKIVGATCALVAAVALSAGSTFAWFSANTSVEATGMEISATSDNKWLVIQAGDTFDPATTATSVSTASTKKSLKPVAPATTISSTNVTTPGSWHYGYSNATNSSAVNGGYTECTSLTDYVASETFSIGLSDKSGATTASNLKLTSVTLPKYDTDKTTGISVVVVCGTNAYTYTASAASIADKKLADSVGKTNDSAAKVTVYYFINGEDPNVYTDNLTNLKGSVVLTFGVD